MANQDSVLTLPREVVRRYLLGKQGLWPGRRWRGQQGAAAALRTLGSVQMDPVSIVARSHDLVLWSRVVGYAPDQLDRLLYDDRAFFDYGGHLDIYPIDELPYWRPHMARRRDDERQARFAAEHGALLDAVRTAVRARGPLGNRDLAGTARIQSYRGRKDTGVALYHLWLTGELLTHSRKGFERLYDLRERIAPLGLDWAASDEEAEAFFAARGLGSRGLFTARDWASYLAGRLHRRADRAAAQAQLDRFLAEETIIAVQIEDQRERHFVPTGERSLLADLIAGRIPRSWRPLGATTAEEVIVLSPLDNLLDRKRTRTIFDFEVVWEIYKPAEKRRWGAYAMPILYGDLLVGRIDPKLDRESATLTLNGLWLEDDQLAAAPAFAKALANGLAAFAHPHAARSIALPTTMPAALRDAIMTTPLTRGDSPAPIADTGGGRATAGARRQRRE